MNKHFSLFLILAVLLSACEQATTPPPPTATQIPPTLTFTPTITPTQRAFSAVTPVCISPAPAQTDIDRALSYTGDIFPASAWEQSYSVADTFVAATWQNVSHNALVYLEARVKPCGYEEPDLNKDFNDETWKIIFANYESYQLTSQCRSDTGLRLYQFKTQSQGFEYAINYWAHSDTDTRVIVTMMVFPVENQALLGTYGAQLFPNLPNCS